MFVVSSECSTIDRQLQRSHEIVFTPKKSDQRRIGQLFRRWLEVGSTRPFGARAIGESWRHYWLQSNVPTVRRFYARWRFAKSPA